MYKASVASHSCTVANNSKAKIQNQENLFYFSLFTLFLIVLNFEVSDTTSDATFITACNIKSIYKKCPASAGHL
jgi:hypothetical protein